MNYPFWIANSALSFFSIFTLVFMYISHKPTPTREDIYPAPYTHPKKEQRIQHINIKQIYENDLFGTYVKELSLTKQPPAIAPLPAPPHPHIHSPAATIEQKFLDPLNITLKGIVVVSTNNRKDRAIISDNKTDFEATYAIGDSIEDAKLIKIFRNKIIFLRSNGQQEVLYLREQDAQIDAAFNAVNIWGEIVQQITPTSFSIDIKGFTKKIKNIAQLISMLNLTTAYDKGIAVGTYVGMAERNSLGAALGLHKGDIITTINTIPATTTDNRFLIYHNVIALSADDTISLDIMRNKKTLSLTYTLQGSEPEKKALPFFEKETIASSPSKVQREQEKALREQYTFAPTVGEMRKRERQNMIERGKLPS